MAPIVRVATAIYFKNQRLKHFDPEEAGGFMADVLNVAPQSGRKVKGLKAEHEEIILKLDKILKGMKSMAQKQEICFYFLTNLINS